MKKILLILMIFLCCSCSSTYTLTSIGNVTAYSSNGDILRKWENVKLIESTNGFIKENSFKTFGYNFYDPYTDNFVIINNAVPCIIEYKVIDDGTISEMTEKLEQIEFEKLIERYNTLCKQKENIEKLLKTLNKNSSEYKETKENLKALENYIKNITQTLWSKYQWSPLGYTY